MKKTEIVEVLSGLFGSKQTKVEIREGIQRVIDGLSQPEAVSSGKRGRKTDLESWGQAFDSYVNRLQPDSFAETANPKEYDMARRIRDAFPGLYTKNGRKIHFQGTQVDIDMIKMHREEAITNTLQVWEPSVSVESATPEVAGDPSNENEFVTPEELRLAKVDSFLDKTIQEAFQIEVA